MKILLIAVIFVAIAAKAEAKKKCFTVSQAECPKKKHEVYSECATCQPTCENPDIVCRAACFPGCVCEKGYIRDSSGKCILREDCPSDSKCGENEKYVECSTVCGEKSCDNSEERHCGLGPCQPKCLCDDGYVRDSNKKCIKAEECPSKDPCKLPIVVGPCRGAFPRYGYDSETKQCKLFSYGGCGGNANNFEHLEECEAKCEKKPICKKKHEFYTNCGTACPSTCDKPIVSGCTKNCVRGCFCEKGYVRDKNGDCVLLKDCPSKACGKNEIWSECDKYCRDMTKRCEHFVNPVSCDRNDCVPGCTCEIGHYRNDKNECVLREFCQSPCGANEVYVECSTLCGEKTCENSEERYCGRGPCQPKCHCKEGYVRNAEKKCIKVENCPAVICKKKHEVYSKCGTACPLTCDKPTMGPCTKNCVRGCFCERGYIRDKNGDCILLKDCPTKLTCDENEEIDNCSLYCNDKTCNHEDKLEFCTPCQPRCHCKRGYVRDRKNKCIEAENCPVKSCPRNEEWTKCNFECTFEKCSHLIRSPVCRPSGCVGGCICKEGYYRDDDKRCVLPEKCPQTITCGDNEKFVACSKVCKEKTCNNNLEEPCRRCQSKCLCKNGYIRSIDDICIKTNECGTADPCSLPIVVGPCKAALIRFAYDAAQQKCVRFTYGGCQGNNNNFKTEADCQRVCDKKDN